MDLVTGASGAAGAVGGGGIVWWLLNKLDRERNARLEAMELAIKTLEEKVDDGLVSEKMCAIRHESADKEVDSLKCQIKKAQDANEKEHRILGKILKEMRDDGKKVVEALHKLEVKFASCRANGEE